MCKLSSLRNTLPTQHQKRKQNWSTKIWRSSKGKFLLQMYRDLRDPAQIDLTTTLRERILLSVSNVRTEKKPFSSLQRQFTRKGLFTRYLASNIMLSFRIVFFRYLCTKEFRVHVKRYVTFILIYLLIFFTMFFSCNWF